MITSINNLIIQLSALRKSYMLQLAGFTVYQRFPNNVTIMGSRGVTIIWACLGFGVMSFWTAFVTAHKATWKFKLKWCLSGIIIIIALNITRITLIALANHYHWLAVTSLEPHTTFNVASYILLFLLVVWFIRRYKHYQQDKCSEPAGIKMAVESLQSTGHIQDLK